VLFVVAAAWSKGRLLSALVVIAIDDAPGALAIAADIGSEREGMPVPSGVRVFAPEANAGGCGSFEVMLRIKR
jgi:hypothetical protein